MSEQGKNGEFYTKGNVVWKSPIVRRNEANNGDSVEVGFAVCTASEWIKAETLAGVFTEHTTLAARVAELEAENERQIAIIRENWASQYWKGVNAEMAERVNAVLTNKEAVSHD
jgi:hypothetical protein